MKRLALVSLAMALAGVACVWSRRQSPPPPSAPPVPTMSGTSAPRPEAAPPVPPEYQPLQDVLTGELAAFESNLNRTWDHSQGQTVFGTELAFANGNVGEALLTPQAMQANRTLLDRLQAMGIKGVVVAIKYPLLRPDFPRSFEYLAFFQQIVAEAHKHNMKVLVEAGAIFAGTPYSTVRVDWSKETTGSFLQGLQDQLVLIAREVKPDYLTLANEPQTEEALTRLDIPPAVWGEFVRTTAAKVDRGQGLLVGAGTGTWEDAAYVQQVIAMPGLDYIDLHVYPLGRDGNLLSRALEIARQAHAAGKGVTISECWLYKAAPEEMGGGLGDVEAIQNRDVFSFWSPLEVRYLKDMMSLADAARLDFASFFWTRNLFTYLDYASTPHDLSTAELNRRINQAAIAAVEDGALSPLGAYFASQLQSRSP